MNYYHTFHNNQFGSYFNKTHIKMNYTDSFEKWIHEINPHSISINKLEQKLLNALCKKDCHQHYYKIYKVIYPYKNMKIHFNYISMMIFIQEWDKILYTFRNCY